jgi:hypothetical protein
MGLGDDLSVRSLPRDDKTGQMCLIAAVPPESE